MIILLYGPDSYRLEQKKRFYLAEFAKKYSEGGIERVDLSEGDTASLDLAARSRSLFEPAKMVVVANAFEAKPKQLKEALRPFLEDKKLNALITHQRKPVKALEFLLKKPVTAAEFPHLEGAAWGRFVQVEANKIGVDLDPQALALLARTYEKDGWGLVTELQKLAATERKLTAEDLAALGLEVAPEFFPLVQSLRAARLGDRFTALARLLHDNEPGAKVFNILSALWAQKTPQFAAYDRAVKMGRMDYEEALTDLVLS